MKNLIAILFLLCALPVLAADLITATVTVTNTAGTTNGQTIQLNADTRTWTNNVQVPGTQILTNATIGGSATNLLNQLVQYPVSGLTPARSGTNAITVRTAPGGSLTVTLSAGWGTVAYSTQSLTAAIAVRVPISVEAGAQQTNIISSLQASLAGNQNTNVFYESSPAVVNLLGKTNAQTISGAKQFTNTANVFSGSFTGAVSITGGTLQNVTFINPTNPASITTQSTNASGGYTAFTYSSNTLQSPLVQFVRYGESTGGVTSNGFRLGRVEFRGFDGTSEMVGAVIVANAAQEFATGANGGALDFQITPYGSDTPASVLWLSNTTAAITGALTVSGASTVAGNETVGGNAAIAGTLDVRGNIKGTNTFAGQVEFVRYANSSLANGNNAAVDVRTNVFVEVSGPTGAFTVNGIAGGRDGRTLIILNQTGQNMTVAHESGVDPAAANRIVSMTGADRATTGNGAATLIYSASASRWILIALDP